MNLRVTIQTRAALMLSMRAAVADFWNLGVRPQKFLQGYVK